LPVGGGDFDTNWYGHSGASGTISSGVSDPNGGANAYRVQTSGGTDVIKYKGQVPNAIPTGTFQVGVWVRKHSSEAPNFYVVHGADWGVSSTLINSTTYQYVSLSKTRTIASQPGIVFKAVQVADNLDIDAYQPQLNLGSLYPYSAPVGLSQTLLDYSGKGNHATLGSNATQVDTADPTWTAKGLYLGADDLIAYTPSTYNLLTWGSTATTYGWVDAIPATTAGYFFGALLINRTPSAGEQTMLKANLATILAGQGVTLA